MGHRPSEREPGPLRPFGLERRRPLKWVAGGVALKLPSISVATGRGCPMDFGKWTLLPRPQIMTPQAL